MASLRDVLFPEEVGGGVLAGDLVEDDEAGACVAARPRLVKANVPASPNAQQHEVNATGFLNLVLVLQAVPLHLIRRQVAARNVNLILGDVDVVEKVFGHKPVIALQARRVNRVVLIQVEGDNVGEIEPLLLVHADQLLIHTDRRRAGRQAEHEVLPDGSPLLDEAGDTARHLVRQLGRVVKDERRDALALGALHAGARLGRSTR